MYLLLKPSMIPIFWWNPQLFMGKIAPFLIGKISSFPGFPKIFGWDALINHQDLSQGFVGREQGGIKGAKARVPWRSVKSGGFRYRKSGSFLGSFGFKAMRIRVSRKSKVGMVGIFWARKNGKHHASQDCHSVYIGIPTSCEPSRGVWAKGGKLALNIVGDTTKYAKIVFFFKCVLLHKLVHSFFVFIFCG